MKLYVIDLAHSCNYAHSAHFWFSTNAEGFTILFIVPNWFNCCDAEASITFQMRTQHMLILQAFACHAFCRCWLQQAATMSTMFAHEFQIGDKRWRRNFIFQEEIRKPKIIFIIAKLCVFFVFETNTLITRFWMRTQTHAMRKCIRIANPSQWHSIIASNWNL